MLHKSKMKISGVAIRPSISRNGISYSAEELQLTAHELADKPIMKDHKSATDNVIGRTTHSSFVNEAIIYEGWIKEDGSGILEKIKDGRIKEVSIGAIVEKLVKINEEDEFLTAQGIHYMELSTTPTPGIVGTSLKQAMDGFKKDNKFTKPVAESFELINEVNEEFELTKDEIKTIKEELIGEEGTSKINTQEEQLAKEESLEVESNIKEETKMVEETKTVETVAEEKVAKVTEEKAPVVDTNAIVEALSKVMDAKFEASEKKLDEKLVALKEELEAEPEAEEKEAPAEEEKEEKEEEAPAEKEAEAPKEEPEFKSEEPAEESEAQEESAKGYCIERLGNGKYAMFKA